MRLTTGEIAERLGARIVGSADVSISGVADARRAQQGEITFAEADSFLDAALKGDASAILVPRSYAPADGKVLLEVKNVRLAFAQILDWFHPEPTYAGKIHASAVVDPSARIDASAYVGPGCCIGADCVLGPKVILCGGNHIGDHCSIGEGTKLFARATLYAGCQVGRRVRIQSGAAVGADGFGYVFDGARHRKIPQVGGVILEDDVELGANVTIDRGALGDTVIGEGTKIDNLVQIAHNVVIGKHCIIVAQTGIAGSTKIGDYTVIAGQVGIAGHLTIGSQVTIAAQSGIMRDIPDGQKVFGSPAQRDRDYKRQLIAMQQLPDIIRRFRQLEKSNVIADPKTSSDGPSVA